MTSQSRAGILHQTLRIHPDGGVLRICDRNMSYRFGRQRTDDRWKRRNGESSGGSETSVSETRTEPTVTLTASGVPKDHERGDVAVVTLHGHDPKPPFDGRSTVSEAERNAFNEEKRIFEKRKETFEREKIKKEKEFSDKEKDFEVRKKFLAFSEESKDDAVDLFDLKEPRVVMRRSEDFYMLRQEKAPYEIEDQNDGGMTIKAKSKKPNVIQSDLNFEIAGTKQPFNDLGKGNGELFV